MVVGRENSQIRARDLQVALIAVDSDPPAPNSLGRDRSRAGPQEPVEVQVVWLSPEPRDSFEEFERFLRRMIARTAFRARRAQNDHSQLFAASISFDD